jgi:hypothetical protein
LTRRSAAESAGHHEFDVAGERGVRFDRVYWLSVDDRAAFVLDGVQFGFEGICDQALVQTERE